MNERIENHPARTGTVLPPEARNNSTTLSERVRSLRLTDQIAAERTPNQRLPWALCVLFGAATLFLAYLVIARPPAPTEEQQPTLGLPTLPTPTRETGPAPGQVALESKGYIIPAHQIQVSPKISGMVVKLEIEEGQKFKKGELLAELESVDYKARRDAAASRLEAARQRHLELKNGSRPEEIKQAEAELAECVAQREQLYLDWKRNVGLKPGMALSQREYEQAESQYRAMAQRAEKLQNALVLMRKGPREERIAAAEAELRQAEAELAEADWRLDNCKVLAPISGTILTKKAEEGNIVNPIAFNISASLCDMADLSDLEVDLEIQERDVAKVFKGQKCRVRADAYPDRVYEGTVSRLMPIANRAKAAVPVRVKLTVPAGEEGVYLKPEMGAVVTFLK